MNLPSTLLLCTQLCNLEATIILRNMINKVTIMLLGDPMIKLYNIYDEGVMGEIHTLSDLQHIPGELSLHLRELQNKNLTFILPM